ncbi:MAG: hypothetical protein ABI613_08325 [Gemmatimonadota bacterium]
MLRRALFLLPLLGVTPALLAQQPLDRFTYDNLGFKGLWPEVGILTSNRLKGTVSYGLRVDVGQFAPRLRVLVGGSYYRSDFKTDEINQFEEALRNVVTDPTGDFTIDLGEIRWSDIELDLDLQYILTTTTSYRPYIGAGAGMHLRNGSGKAINGTFVEDALDMLGAGVSLTAGMDVMLSRGFLMNLGGRAVFSSDLQTVGLTVGLGYRK